MKNLKYITIFLTLFLTFSVSSLAFGRDPEQLEDTLAKGYLAASKGATADALVFFDEAGKLANKLKNWRGLIDSGNAFSALGDTKKALFLFDKAHKSASARKDWRGFVAVSYAYLSLPEEMKTKKKALSALNVSYKLSYSRKDWRGLFETAKAMLKTGEKNRTREILISSEKIVISSGSKNAANSFAVVAKQMGDKALYEKYMTLASEVDTKAVSVTPPPGWKAYGESVAGPKKIDPSAQEAMRHSADKEIEASKNTYETRKKDNEFSEYYVVYRDYYAYPFQHNYYNEWHTLSGTQVERWANYRLSRYKNVRGTYIYEY